MTPYRTRTLQRYCVAQQIYTYHHTTDIEEKQVKSNDDVDITLFIGYPHILHGHFLGGGHLQIQSLKRYIRLPGVCL